MKFRVHIYTVVRIPVDVEADSPKEAAKKADDYISKGIGFHGLLDRDNGIEWAEEVLGYLVDSLDEKGNVICDEYFDEKEIFNEEVVS